jgi:hypothetical protein
MFDIFGIKTLTAENEHLEDELLRIKIMFREKERIVNEKNDVIMKLKVKLEKALDIVEEIVLQVKPILEQKETLLQLITMIEKLEIAMEIE